MDSSKRHTPTPEFCAAIHDARVAAGLSFREFARAAGMSLGHASGLEHGTRCPSTSLAEDVIRALGATGEVAEAIRAGAIRDVGRDWPGRRLSQHQRRLAREQLAWWSQLRTPGRTSAMR